jgi:hypothetical protein
VLGPEDLSCNDMAQIMFAVLGSPRRPCGPVRLWQDAVANFELHLLHGHSQCVGRTRTVVDRRGAPWLK